MSTATTPRPAEETESRAKAAKTVWIVEERKRLEDGTWTDWSPLGASPELGNLWVDEETAASVAKEEAMDGWEYRAVEYAPVSVSAELVANLKNLSAWVARVQEAGGGRILGLDFGPALGEARAAIAAAGGVA